jgi:hypothetical protein
LSQTEIYTYQDAVEHLADMYNAKRSKELLRSMRRAILQAYRDLPNLRRWVYFDRRYTLRVSASYSTGTVVYDHTGGASERLLTLTTGTWPTDADYGRVRVGGKTYDIETRQSDSLVTLSPNSNPGEDVSSTTYTWFREQYPLPTDFKKIRQVYDTDRDEQVYQVDSDRHHDQSLHFFETPDTPWTCTVKATGDYLGALSLVFSPPPSSDILYDILYEAAPRPLNLEVYNTGTVSVSAGSTSLTSSGATFPRGCEGSIIRFSANGSTLPTGPVGDLAGNDNLYYAQRVIVTRSSASALVLDQSMTDALSAVKFTISDPIDLETKAMYTAFIRMAENEYAKLRNLEPAVQAAAEKAMYRAISMAGEFDSRMPNSSHPTFYDPFRRPTITQD